MMVPELLNTPLSLGPSLAPEEAVGSWRGSESQQRLLSLPATRPTLPPCPVAKVKTFLSG